MMGPMQMGDGRGVSGSGLLEGAGLSPWMCRQESVDGVGNRRKWSVGKMEEFLA
jgi:hypothetical protein